MSRSFCSLSRCSTWQARGRPHKICFQPNKRPCGRQQLTQINLNAWESLTRIGENIEFRSTTEETAVRFTEHMDTYSKTPACFAHPASCHKRTQRRFFRLQPLDQHVQIVHAGRMGHDCLRIAGERGFDNRRKVDTAAYHSVQH